MERHNTVRDTRTLLFCKLSDSETEERLEDKLCNLSKLTKNLTDGELYYTFGRYNALYIYPTLTETEATESSNWLRKVYDDKQRFANQTQIGLVCQQMHLIAQSNKAQAFWNASEKDYPYFFVTLIYGVLRKSGDTVNDLQDSECSLYEHHVSKYLRANETNSKKHCIYAIYNGINISDIVVFWKSNNIGETLSLISKLGYGNVARKSLTTLAFPVSKNGYIKREVLDLLSKQKDKLELLIRGTIKTPNKFDTLLQKFNTASSPFSLALNPGKYDFTLSNRINAAELAKIITNVFYDQFPLINSVCWDIYVDILIPQEQLMYESALPQAPTSIIKQLYKTYLNLYKERNLSQHSWGNPLLEQYSTQYYIDQHPTLHGPSYLVYHSLHIINSYLSGHLDTSFMGKKATETIYQSEDSLNHFIICLDILMDQIINNDNAMLGGYPTVHSVPFSLPESILDFYHAFLRKTVDTLIAFDSANHRIPEDFEYDFLFTPKQGPRFRFCSVFKTDIRNRADKNSNKIWPVKQAYVLEVPIKNLFEPLMLFPPMVHECFHCFGDELRQRELRESHMAYFLSMTVITLLGFSGDSYNTLLDSFAKFLCINNSDRSEPYLSETITHLEKRIYSLFSEKEALDDLFTKTNNTAYCLYTSATASKFHNILCNFYGNNESTTCMITVINACKYYFKECYADAMTIALLGLTPFEYLNLLNDELKFLDHPEFYGDEVEESVQLAQRVAIVFTACSESNVFTTGAHANSHDIINSINLLKSKHPLKSDAFFEFLTKYYNALTLEEVSISFGASLKSAFPPAALRYVVDYLKATIRSLYKNSLAKAPYSINDLRNDFNDIIRNGNMFGRRFYQLIYDQHEEIRAYINQNKDLASSY